MKNITEYENEIKELKEKLNKANKLIEFQKIEIQDLKNQINLSKNIENNNIKDLNYALTMKDNIINQLKQQLENLNNNTGNYPKKQINIEDMRCVNFITTDQSLFYAVSCSGQDTFAEVEEKLYKEYPEYRETNNTFLANGNQVLRFKTISENKIGSGLPVTLIVPS